MLAPRLDASPACHSSPLLVMQPTFQTVLKASSDPEAKPTQGVIVTRNCMNSVHIQVWSMSVGIKALEIFDIIDSIDYERNDLQSCTTWRDSKDSDPIQAPEVHPQ